MCVFAMHICMAGMHSFILFALILPQSCLTISARVRSVLTLDPWLVPRAQSPGSFTLTVHGGTKGHSSGQVVACLGSSVSACGKS